MFNWAICECSLSFRLMSLLLYCNVAPQVLMWWTGSFTMWKGSQIAGKHVNMRATCWKLATSDTPSIRSPSLNSATMSLETSVAVSGLAAFCLTVDSAGCKNLWVSLYVCCHISPFFSPQTWLICLFMIMTVPVGAPQIRTLSPLCPTLGQPLGRCPCLISSPFHIRMTCRSLSMAGQLLAVQEASTVVSAAWLLCMR